MNAIAPAFGCVSGGMAFEDAMVRVLDLAAYPLATETVPIESCEGRTLAEPFQSRMDMPGFDQAAMDGYAVRSDRLASGSRLLVTGRTAAGEPPGLLADDGVHRVLTGAPIPVGADAVIAQEHVERHGEIVHIGKCPPPGTNLRRRGEDIRRGQVLIGSGTQLDWRHIAVLAAQGASAVQVRRCPRIALLSSGRELRGSAQALSPGEIHDSNQPMLTVLLRGWGATVRIMAVVPDDSRSMCAALRDAAENADLVLTTAGISVGDEDHVRDALRTLGGDLTVLKVAMKPGKPLAMGRLAGALFVGLPGNPIAALAGAVAFVRPLLARMTGADTPRPLRVQAGFGLRRQPGRTELILAYMRQSGATLWADRAGPDGSGRLAPLLNADGFAFLPADADDFCEGQQTDFLPFRDGLTRTGQRSR